LLIFYNIILRISDPDVLFDDFRARFRCFFVNYYGTLFLLQDIVFVSLHYAHIYTKTACRSTRQAESNYLFFEISISELLLVFLTTSGYICRTNSGCNSHEHQVKSNVVLILCICITSCTKYCCFFCRTSSSKY